MVIGCLAAAAGLSYVRTELSNVKVVSLGVSLAPRTSPDHVRNILVIGTDSAARLPANDPIREQRSEGELLADVIMVLRLDPKKNTASLLSIPRDTYVPIAGSNRPSKINSAIFGANGADRLIQTIKQNFGVSIDNYVQIDFEGFRDLVKALDGVPMYVRYPIRDTNTGLLIKQTGCVLLDPVQSLAYARSRHMQYQDPKTKKWTEDGTSDLGRISRQQAFIQRAAHRAVDKGARNPATALQLIDAATHVITMDDTMKLGDIKDVVDRFRNFDVDSLQKYQLPTTGAGDTSFSYQEVNWNEADPILDIFRGTVAGQPPDPSEVQVSVAAGSAPAGDATAIANKLTAADFDADLATTSSRTRTTARTTIAYGPRGQRRRRAAVALPRCEHHLRAGLVAAGGPTAADPGPGPQRGARQAGRRRHRPPASGRQDAEDEGRARRDDHDHGAGGSRGVHDHPGTHGSVDDRARSAAGRRRARKELLTPGLPGSPG